MLETPPGLTSTSRARALVLFAVAVTSACASSDGGDRSKVDNPSSSGGSAGGGGSSAGGITGTAGAAGSRTGGGGSSTQGGAGAGGAVAGLGGSVGGTGVGTGGSTGGSGGTSGSATGGSSAGGGGAGASGQGGTDGGGVAGAGGAPDGGVACGTTTCGVGEICITGRCAGCCDLPPACIPIPTGCTGALGCGCFDTDPCGGCTTCQSATTTTITCGNCMCLCAAAWSPVATPSGPRRIADLRVGDLVYTVDHGERVVAPIARVNRQPVEGHAVVRVTLSDGERVEMSDGHPTADGARFDALAAGQRLGAAQIVSVETVPYDEPFTYDILPASDTGTYFVGDAWVGSTLAGGCCGR